MDKIKSERKRLNLSQYALAKASGIGRFKISLAESGYVPFTKQERQQISRALSLIEKEKRGRKK